MIKPTTAIFRSSISKTVTTQNLFPDMTAENHGFHPEVLVYSSWVILAMAAYSIQNREWPEYFCRKSHQRTFDILMRFCLPTGVIFTPGGHDMPMFMPRPFAQAWGLWHNDPRALHLTGRLLSWMDTCLLNDQENQGPWVFGLEQNHEGWELLFQSQVGLELSLLACLPLSKEQRNFSPGQIENAVDTRHIYPYVEVCYRRNIRSIRSVAWKAIGNHLIGFNIHSKPELIAQFKHHFSVSIRGKCNKILEVAFTRTNFFVMVLTPGKDQLFRFAWKKIFTRYTGAWGEDGMIVLDRIAADSPAFIHEQYLSPVYLVNDHWTNNNLEFLSSLRVFQFIQRKFREVNCPSFWASVEAVCFQFVWDVPGIYYLPGGEKNAHRSGKTAELTCWQCMWSSSQLNLVICFIRSDFISARKRPQAFQVRRISRRVFRGLVIMDGKITMGLD